MTSMVFLLSLIAVLLGTAALAAALSRTRIATPVIYSLALADSILLFTAVLVHFVGAPVVTSTLTLPLGLPWLGAHFRLDALAAFFLLVVNLGGAAASLYGLGYGRHETEPRRVLPFFPAFLAGMNLVVLADDAYTFLSAWEFMSLVSWALVMAHHRAENNARAGYVYIVMASFGTLALLLAFGLLAGPDGDYAFDAMRSQSRSPAVGGSFARSCSSWYRIEGRACAAPCLAAPRSSCRTEPCFGADERCDDEGRDLRLRSYRL